MNRFLTICTLLLTLGALSDANAQVGPVGPKSEPVLNPTADPTATPTVDLPYKPQAEPVRRAPVNKEPLTETEPKSEPQSAQPVPYIPSKSPDSFGARDPVIE